MFAHCRFASENVKPNATSLTRRVCEIVSFLAEYARMSIQSDTASSMACPGPAHLG